MTPTGSFTTFKRGGRLILFGGRSGAGDKKGEERERERERNKEGDIQEWDRSVRRGPRENKEGRVREEDEGKEGWG